MKKSVIVAAAGLSLLAAQLPTPASAQACKLTAIGSAEVAAVRDGRTLLLGDGRELRLAAIEPVDDGAALRALAQGRALRLEKLGAERSYYTERDRVEKETPLPAVGFRQRRSPHKAVNDSSRPTTCLRS